MLQRICVFCGSSPGAGGGYLALARDLGTLLTARGIGVVYGGGSVGLMGAVADAAVAAGGEVTGVLPRALDRREVAHRGLTRLEVVGSMHERKARMAELSDAFVALPGGIGTLEELVEVTTWTQLGIHRKPVGLLDGSSFYDELVALLDHMVRERFLSPHGRGLVLRDREPAALLDRLATWQPAPAPPKWLRTGPPLIEEVGPRGPLVGVSAIVVRDGRVLLGRRQGAHGAGTWSPPGGRIEPGEPPADAAVRELHEETGLVAGTVAPVGWTDDVVDAQHWITLHHVVAAGGEPERREPTKVGGWSFAPWGALPEPLFAPIASLRASGWRP